MKTKVHCYFTFVFYTTIKCFHASVCACVHVRSSTINESVSNLEDIMYKKLFDYHSHKSQNRIPITITNEIDSLVN